MVETKLGIFGDHATSGGNSGAQAHRSSFFPRSTQSVSKEDSVSGEAGAAGDLLPFDGKRAPTLAGPGRNKIAKTVVIFRAVVLFHIAL